jgi:hydrogenase nickel incorporation protein HypB
MCDTCGCTNENSNFAIHHLNEHKSHDHDHHHEHSEEVADRKTILVETNLLSKNNLLAERNRGYFEAKNIKAFNFVSSPGSGKTTILEQIIKTLSPAQKVYVIEGDQQTSIDAERINIAGAMAIQINTGKGCHLDAHVINHAVKDLNPVEGSFLFIENVGNLICPALFDLGEKLRIAVISVTEGEDKPLKYPDIFQSSQICLLNKMDLLPYLDFNLEKFKANLIQVNAEAKLILTSAKTGDGISQVIECF